MYNTDTSKIAIANAARLVIDIAALAVGFFACRLIKVIPLFATLLAIAIGLSVGGLAFLKMIADKARAENEAEAGRVAAMKIAEMQSTAARQEESEEAADKAQSELTKLMDEAEELHRQDVEERMAEAAVSSTQSEWELSDE